MGLVYRILATTSADLDKVKYTFESSFPEEERPPFEMALSWEHSSFYAVYNEEGYAGLVDIVEYLDLVYIFFLAVEEKHRHLGIGGTILSDLKEKYVGKRIFLLAEELDPKYDNYEERLTRLRFYEKNGFQRSGVFILEFGVRYEMLIGSSKVSKEEFVATMTYLIGEELAKIYYANV